MEFSQDLRAIQWRIQGEAYSAMGPLVLAIVWASLSRRKMIVKDEIGVNIVLFGRTSKTNFG